SDGIGPHKIPPRIKENVKYSSIQQVPHEIPPRIKEYEKYSNIQQGKLVWICNFEQAPKSLKAMIENMFAPCKPAFKKQHHMMGTYPGKSCKYQIESELTKTDNTDCFICIVSSYGNYYNICYEGKPDRDEESISTLSDSDVFKVHKDWLIVLVRHEESTFFIETLKNEIGEMHDKLDLVSILERGSLDVVSSEASILTMQMQMICTELKRTEHMFMK
ncbi:hypothetical protein MAR_032962, partial [Mya arenaria]